MVRKELISNITSMLRDNNIRKPISVPKHVFHISDDDGNEKDFVVKKTDKTAIYTVEDVDAIIRAFELIVADAIKRGDTVSIRGFGSFGLHYRKARTAIHPDTGENVVVPARYVPKFTFGNTLRKSARVYEASLNDRAHTHIPEPRYDDIDIDDEDFDGGDL